MVQIKFDVEWEVKDEVVLEGLKEILYQSMTKMQEIAVNLAPVKTGRLKNSINLFPQLPGATSYVLADGVEYGIYQEFGTHKMSPQPFFRPALDQVKNVWLSRFIEMKFPK